MGRIKKIQKRIDKKNSPGRRVGARRITGEYSTRESLLESVDFGLTAFTIHVAWALGGIGSWWGVNFGPGNRE